MKRLFGVMGLMLVTVLFFTGCPIRYTFSLSGTVSIIGRAAVGETLTANFSGTETVAWQWIREGADIPGATNQTFAPTQEGPHQVRASASGFRPVISDVVMVVLELEPVPPLESIGAGTFTATGEGVGFAATEGSEGLAGKDSNAPGIGTLIPVNVTVVDRFITSVTYGTHYESPLFVEFLMDNLPQVFIDNNTFDITREQVNAAFAILLGRPVDAITGVTLTFYGIMEAGNNALDKIRAQQ